MIKVCDLPECRKVYEDKEKMKEIEIKKEVYMCMHRYESIKKEMEIIEQKKKLKIKTRPIKKIREKKDID